MPGISPILHCIARLTSQVQMSLFMTHHHSNPNGDLTALHGTRMLFSMEILHLGLTMQIVSDDNSMIFSSHKEFMAFFALAQ